MDGMSVGPVSVLSRSAMYVFEAYEVSPPTGTTPSVAARAVEGKLNECERGSRDRK